MLLYLARVILSAKNNTSKTFQDLWKIFKSQFYNLVNPQSDYVYSRMSLEWPGTVFLLTLGDFVIKNLEKLGILSVKSETGGFSF